MKPTESEIRRKVYWAIERLRDEEIHTGGLDEAAAVEKLSPIIQKMPGGEKLSDSEGAYIKGYLHALIEYGHLEKPESHRSVAPVHDPGREYDLMRWEIAVLHRVARSQFGERLREFRQRYLDGKVLAAKDYVDWVQQWVCNTTGSDNTDTSEEIRPFKLISEADLPDDLSVRVDHESMAYELWLLCNLFARTMKCNLNRACEFCLCGTIPPFGKAVRIDPDPGPGSFLDALWFDASMETEPIRIISMPWVSPDRVKDTIRKYHAESWIGNHNPGSDVSLSMVTALLRSRMDSCRDIDHITKEDWDEVYRRWQTDFPKYKTRYTRSQFPSICTRALHRLTFTNTEATIDSEFEEYSITPEERWTLYFLRHKLDKDGKPVSAKPGYSIYMSRAECFNRYPGKTQQDRVSLPVYSEKTPSVCREGEVCESAHLELISKPLNVVVLN